MMLFNSAFSSAELFPGSGRGGASSWQKFRDIGLPLIRGHIVSISSSSPCGRSTFTPFLLTNGGPSYRTNWCRSTIPRRLHDFQFGKGAAVGVS